MGKSACKECRKENVETKAPSTSSQIQPSWIQQKSNSGGGCGSSGPKSPLSKMSRNVLQSYQKRAANLQRKESIEPRLRIQRETIQTLPNSTPKSKVKPNLEAKSDGYLDGYFAGIISLLTSASEERRREEVKHLIARLKNILHEKDNEGEDPLSKEREEKLKNPIEMTEEFGCTKRGFNQQGKDRVSANDSLVEDSNTGLHYRGSAKDVELCDICAYAITLKSGFSPRQFTAYGCGESRAALSGYGSCRELTHIKNVIYSDDYVQDKSVGIEIPAYCIPTILEGSALNTFIKQEAFNTNKI
ncbi:MAG: hypothetical protein AAGD25_08380 [Cyanobacteria bacterium P01_F01_bin.150]